MSSPFVPKDQLKDENKQIGFEIIQRFKGADLIDLTYEQLIPFATPFENAHNAFKIIHGDFVSTEDGTGIVHIAPTFGADDAKVAENAGVPPMLIKNKAGELVPLVDLQGKFLSDLDFLSGKFVKNEYYNQGEEPFDLLMLK